MLLYLINPSNLLSSIARSRQRRWSRYWNSYRMWKPLSLMVLAGVTPGSWEVCILDENLKPPDYSAIRRPDLVGITAFTAQANRAYEIAAHFRSMNVPVVMGGIHATMCQDEALERVDSVVTGEGEDIWAQVLDDAACGRLKRKYEGGLADLEHVPLPRHDLLDKGYAYGAIQTTRGCPMNCNFCSVTAFNGARYRKRPISELVREFRLIPEKRVLVVDDNLIGSGARDIDRAKKLFGAMAQADLGKQWIAQVGINFADDEELLALAAKAGCKGVFIGFESVSAEGLQELGKSGYKGRDLPASVRRIQRYNILVLGSFILGLDVDTPGTGKRIAEAARLYKLDLINVLFLTPLPGTPLWNQMKSQNRIALDRFPQDWKYYTLTFPVARYKHLNLDKAIEEMRSCERVFYSTSNIPRRILDNLRHRRQPLNSLIGNLSYRSNRKLYDEAYADLRKNRV